MCGFPSSWARPVESHPLSPFALRSAVSSPKFKLYSVSQTMHGRSPYRNLCVFFPPTGIQEKFSIHIFYVPCFTQMGGKRSDFNSLNDVLR